jgi:hypothetical protein
MKSRVSISFVFAAIAAGSVMAGPAQAQYATAYQSPQYFPYVGPTHAPRAASAVHKQQTTRRGTIRHYRSARCTHDCVPARRVARTRKHGAPVKQAVVHKRRVAYAKPIVIEARHVVGEPPRATQRRHSLGGTTASTRGKRVANIGNPAPRAKSGRGKKKDRVIHADAEVTIIGPDRMIIRLSRKKSRGNDRSARAD